MVKEKNFELYVENNKGRILKDLSSLLHTLEELYDKKPYEYQFSARLDYFYGFSREVFAEERRMKLLTKIRDYLFQKDRVKPRLIAPDRRRK